MSDRLNPLTASIPSSIPTAPSSVSPNVIAPDTQSVADTTPATTAPAARGDQFTAPANTKDAKSGKDSGSSSVKDKVTTLLWNAASQKVEIPLANISLIKAKPTSDTQLPGLLGLPDAAKNAMGIRVTEQLIPPKDDVLTKDPQRSAYEKTATQPHIWARTGGLIDASIGLNTSIPVGPATAQVGFNSSGVLEYSVLAPHTLNAKGAEDAAKVSTIDLPVTAKNARALPQGAEFMMRGTGTVGASAGIGVGASEGVGPLHAGATVGVSGSITAKGELTVNVKRLDGDKVYVRLGKSDKLSDNATLGVHAGLTLTDSAIATAKADVPHNTVMDFIADKGTDEAKSQIADKLNLQASVSTGAAKETNKVAAFVLDLSHPADRKAYESLMKLDTGPASALPDTKSAAYEESGKSKDHAVDVHIGPAKLLLMNSLRTDRTGDLTSTGGDMDFKQSTFDKSTQLLIGGKRDISWEGLTSSKNGADPQTVFHLKLDQNRDVTREGDVQGFSRLATALNAAPDGATKQDAQKNDIERLFLGKYGKSEEKVDLYFTSPGLKKLQSVSSDQVMSTFAHTAQQLEGAKNPPAWSVPGQGDQALAQIAAYRQFNGAGSDETEKKQNIAADYQRTFGRDIGDDAKDYDSAQLLAHQVGSMKGQPESQWAQAFANLGQKSGYDFSKHVATLSALVGPGDTLVHQMSLSGNRINLAAHDQGMVQSADKQIGDLLALP